MQPSPLRRPSAWLALAALIVACQRPGPPAPAPRPAIHAARIPATVAPLTDDPAAWRAWERADLAIVVPRAFRDAVAPLAQHREREGHHVAVVDVEALRGADGKGAEAVQAGLARLVEHTGGRLRYVLLAAAPPRTGAGADAPGEPTIPTFYLPKLAYERHGEADHDHGRGHLTHAKFPSDLPYAEASGGDAAPLAVGRLPARSADELARVVGKVIAYDGDAGGEWQRRVSVLAGPANYGPVVDGVIEAMTTEVLDRRLSYDFDVRFTFAKPGSPYAYPLDRLHDRFADDLGDGALVFGYVGHGAVWSFDHVHWRGRSFEIGTTADAARARIPAGKPLFFSIACDTGAFDRPFGSPSLAEELALNPDGPIGVVASSRESHPYANALLGQAMVSVFLDARAETIGDGLRAVRAAMRAGRIPMAEPLVEVDVAALKREHEGLYNLLGDPATRLRYPARATITGPPGAIAGRPVRFTIAAPPAGSRARVTVETLRSALRGSFPDPAALEEMPVARAFEKMSEAHARANDKVVATADVALTQGRGELTVDAPAESGDYVVKVLVRGDGPAAAAHTRLRVAPAAGR